MRKIIITENPLEISYQPNNKNYEFILVAVANLCRRRSYFKTNDTLSRLFKVLFSGELDTNSEKGSKELWKMFFSYRQLNDGCFYTYSKLLKKNLTLPSTEACIEAENREKLVFFLKEFDSNLELHQINNSEDRYDFATTYSCFVSFYEKYRRELELKYSIKHFYDVDLKKINNETWSLAKILRDSISHSEILGSSHKYDYLTSILSNNIDLHLFGEKIELSDWKGKLVNEAVNSIDLIILMIAMENELSRENITI